MKTTLKPAAPRTLDDLIEKTGRPERRKTSLAGEPFVSPVANIPTNRTPLTPATRPG